MLPYVRIASALEEIGRASKCRKADLAGNFLAGLDYDQLCPSVRLLTGELWPSWELKELGVGPKALLDVLADISREDISILQRDILEIGSLAEAALKHKSQQLLCPSALDAMSVYKRLRHISDLSGRESDCRKAAILRGLLLETSPLEGKYIARAIIGSTLVGLGPKNMISAISLAFNYDYYAVRRAYNLLPDLGMLALLASKRELENISIHPPRPVRLMRMRQREEMLPGAYLPRHAGLRVQVHAIKNVFHVYTFRLRSITPALASLSHDLALCHDFVAEAYLIGFQDGKILGQSDIVRYINRRHLSRRSSIVPALVAYDLLYIDGEDLTGIGYAKRRRRMISLFGEPKSPPFRGISPAEERVLEDPGKAKAYYDQILGQGGRGLIMRDLCAAYHPGEYGSDVILS